MIVLFSLLIAIFMSCAGSPSAGNQAQQPLSAPPLWVTDTARAYPDSEWLVVVEREVNAQTAERAAISRLAQVFHVDLQLVTTANRELAEVVDNTRGQTVVMSSESREFAQELVSASAVSGLIGLQIESWTAYEGRAYANARINRREGSARYSAMIRENERVISQLIEEAGRRPQTFEAVQMLNLAHSFAAATDNFHSLLTVLDPSAIATRPSYGNAEAVKSLAQSAGQAIVVTIAVDGDDGGRITRAFTESLNSRGFRTSAAGANPYVLSVSFELENVDLNHATNRFVRYVLNGSLKNRAGVEIFSFSENRREGHLNESEARQRAIRAAEQSIGSSGFSSNFDAFMASLL